MTKNLMKISLPFSFKGANLRPGCTIDLDRHMERDEALPCLYTHIADDCGIDPYSHQRDVMMMGTLEFDEVTGFAGDFVHEAGFDSEGFEREWLERRLRRNLEGIALRYMGKALADDMALNDALRAAYALGSDRHRAPQGR